jgi:hypothetical protein
VNWLVTDLAGNFVIGELAEELEHELAGDLVGDKLANLAGNFVIGELEAELADEFVGGKVGDLAADEFSDENLPGDLVTEDNLAGDLVAEDNMANDLVAEVRLAVEFACDLVVVELAVDLMDEEKQSGAKEAFEFPGGKVTSVGGDVIGPDGDLRVNLTGTFFH